MRRLWTIAIVALVAACSPVYRFIDYQVFDVDDVAPVVGLPPGYDRTSPTDSYDGPHPSKVTFRTSDFALPVRIGEVGPIDHSLGGLQYPFACETEKSGLGQPLVDNLEGVGTPVFVVEDDGDKTDEIIGFRKDCLIPTRASYFYKVNGTKRKFRRYSEKVDPQFVEQVTIDGREVPFIIRLERGSINRFIYALAVLADPSRPLDQPSKDYWNGKLIYYFRGGVGIGKRQGDVTPATPIKRRVAELARGYAVAYSSGNHTVNHYNMWLAAHTAAMVKAQFVGVYGEPDYTVGLGESGGAIQQYLIAQNLPGLLDGIIPIYSYPDMVTQTIWVLDCELLEYYFDETDRRNARWREPENRTLVLGLSAQRGARNVFAKFDNFARVMSLRMPRVRRGATECSMAWRGLTPLTNNPTFYHEPYRFSREISEGERFSHWHDLKNFYGVDEYGYARRTHDNVGVQYGLHSLASGVLTPEEFLHLNANVGGWKHPKDLEPERFWFFSDERSLRKVSIWSQHNMRPALANGVRPRDEGDIGAIRAAYLSGQVFLGTIDLPIIDVRHYLDKKLDMHHSFASFSSRLRLEAGNGHSDNMIVWMSDYPYDPTPQALDVMDEWIKNIRRRAATPRNYPRTVVESRPAAAVDACLDKQGRLIDRGEGVWNGKWNGRPDGSCMARYPIFQSPRNVAGEPFEGDVFKCAVQSVESALAKGLYGKADISSHLPRLKEIFPRGVCDYSKPDQGRPVTL
ncbi:MAG: DUF6351 family protein [Gammaproteobacteria bacterium]|nr:DUF6351 family protein [Gammaproteobacteria bacterium]